MRRGLGGAVSGELRARRGDVLCGNQDDIAARPLDAEMPRGLREHQKRPFFVDALEPAKRFEI